MRWILYILIFLALLVLAGFLFPRTATTERSVYIAEPPQVVFPYLNNFRHFNKWSPWYQLDPETEYRYEGLPEGSGAVMKWTSDNPSVGNGSQTITASEPYSRVATALDFGEQGTAKAEFDLKPQGSGTNVTWSFSSDMGGGPIARWMGLMVSKMVGQSYEEGLQNLKELTESEGAPKAQEAPTAPPAGRPTERPTESPATTIPENPVEKTPENSDSGRENQIIEGDDIEVPDSDGDAIEGVAPEEEP